MSQPDTSPAWSEADSDLYRQIAPIAVPARAEQLAALLSLLPFNVDDSFRAVEIGAGEGFLSAALLSCFPKATVTTLDGSEQMRQHTGQRLARFGGRGQVLPFELAAANWRHHLHQADAVLSSLCLHHLNGLQKAALFEEAFRAMSPCGALLIADLVAPQRPEANALFAAGWDGSARQQAVEQTGSEALFQQFQRAEWNLYHFPDPVDKPSPLFQQLQWLAQAGFTAVDCFWLQAGHAIYGGYKGSPSRQNPLSFETALVAARAELSRAM
ncbi:MAG: hypothetical protein Kow0031_03000 [Anaerolineae bacterium]